MLLQVEAIVALGRTSLTELREGVPDPDLPDPGSVFAVVFTWLHADEAEWARLAISFLKALGHRAGSERAAATEGLALGPSAAVIDAVIPLLDEEEPKLRAAAVRILGYRGSLTQGSWIHALEDDDAGVRLAAIQAPLAGYDDMEAVHHLSRLDPSEHLAWQRQLRLAGLGHASGLSRARKVLAQEPGHPAALGIVSSVGELCDLQLLKSCAMRTGSGETLDAIAQIGYVEAVPWLLGVARQDGVPKEYSAKALQAAAIIIGATDVGNQAGDLEAWWHDHRSLFNADRRYHQGHVDDAQGLLKALHAPKASRRSRLHLYDRLAGRVGLKLPRFHPYDFIGSQQRDLNRISTWLQGHQAAGGVRA